MKKINKITPIDRTQLMVETGLVCLMTSLSGGFYLFGDIFKKFSKTSNGIGAQLDIYALDILEFTVETLEKFVWKEHLDG